MRKSSQWNAFDCSISVLRHLCTFSSVPRSRKSTIEALMASIPNDIQRFNHVFWYSAVRIRSDGRHILRRSAGAFHWSLPSITAPIFFKFTWLYSCSTPLRFNPCPAHYAKLRIYAFASNNRKANVLETLWAVYEQENGVSFLQPCIRQLRVLQGPIEQVTEPTPPPIYATGLESEDSPKVW